MQPYNLKNHKIFKSYIVFKVENPILGPNLEHSKSNDINPVFSLWVKIYDHGSCSYCGMWIIISFDFFDFDFLDFFFFGLIFSSFEFSLKLSRVLFGIVIEECSSNNRLAKLKLIPKGGNQIKLTSQMCQWQKRWKIIILDNFSSIFSNFATFLCFICLLFQCCHCSRPESQVIPFSKFTISSLSVCRTTHLRLLPAVT